MSKLCLLRFLFSSLCGYTLSETLEHHYYFIRPVSSLFLIA
ncbi:hypothetical protein J604_1206 [Acinetobacter sp. 694762]|nr:hypothetical protein J514_4115 [Acinetobacter sp. 1396970]EXI12956.1 hypothetical protein J604_1206 [Acinetobacter sp. 694762]